MDPCTREEYRRLTKLFPPFFSFDFLPFALTKTKKKKQKKLKCLLYSFPWRGVLWGFPGSHRPRVFHRLEEGPKWVSLLARGKGFHLARVWKVPRQFGWVLATYGANAIKTWNGGGEGFQRHLNGKGGGWNSSSNLKECLFRFFPEYF